METEGLSEAVQRQLDRELGLIRDAIAMVAAGKSPRVTIAGLRLGDALLVSAERLASQAGVRIVPRWPTDESGLDITVEKLEVVPS